MAKKRKNGNYKQNRPAPPPANAPQTPRRDPKRMALMAVRWSAWIVLLCVILTQLTGNPLEDAAALGMFVIAGLLYAISVVLERKYKW